MYKVQMFIKSFVINIGLFKTFAFFALVGISIQCVEAIPMLSGALSIQRLSIGEYVNGVLLIVVVLLISVIYMCYFIDSILKWAFKMDD